MNRRETQRQVAAVLKDRGPSTIDEIATELGATYETARASVARLGDLGHIESVVERGAGVGRPASRWRLTRSGEHLFPKRYGELAITLLAAAGDTLPDSQLDELLAAVVDQKVASWLPALENADVETRLEALKAIYDDDDPFVSIERGDGRLRLVERNCPFLDVASHHPVLCGLTINTLSRVLGRRVVREETFQAGAGRCVFLITDEPWSGARFERET